MPKEDAQLTAAKRSYRSAKEEGNRQEEARWANVIGDILKSKGEYVEAIHWLRRDYEISVKYLPEKQLLPTCQSLGEVYLRLQDFKEALTYQKKHLELAKDAEDLIEQQRASTQLGRTYHDIFLKSDDDHSAVRNAIKYFNSAMELARALKENSHGGKYSFVKEYIDAHNNIGMLEMDLDNLKEAKKILTKGLEICDEEEVNEDDDTRSRLHHHLGIVYMELREWDKAAEHIREDILICARIGHCQGEAKGYINLGELHYRIQKYDKASRCYHKALDLAKTMEDEDALVAQINQNIETVKQAVNVMKELKKEEQNLKKLTRMIEKGAPHERKLLLQQSACLDRLIDMSNSIFAWTEHRVFAKRKKRIASELCDKEKLGDSFLVLGESYQKLRNFKKAIKWFTKSWETYKSIGNMEGQALAKINIGDVLDCDGDWRGALNAFEEGYRIAVEANLPTAQLSALENIHYSHMIRFDNAEEARRLQQKIDNLKKSKNREPEIPNFSIDFCPETDTEEEDHFSASRSDESCSPEINKSSSFRSRLPVGVEEFNDDVPLISLLRSSKNSSRKKRLHEETICTSNNRPEASLTMSKSSDLQTTRKRVRVVLSDDEDEMQDNMDCSKRFPLEEHIATSNESERKNNPASTAQRFQDNSTSASKCVTGSSNPANIEEITSSNKSPSPKIVTPAGKDLRCMRVGRAVFASDVAVIGTKCNTDVFEDLSRKHNAAQLLLHDSDNKDMQYITFRIGNGLLHAEADPFLDDNTLRVKSMKVSLACLYYLQLPAEMRSKGLLPIIQQMKCGGRVLQSMETLESLKDDIGNILIEVSIEGWIQKRLIKLYIDCCDELSEEPNIKLLENLYISEVEDEVIASECDLQDISVTPLLNALHTHRTVAMLNLSHNLLGNATMEKLQRFFTTGEKYGNMTLDLHCNRFGPTALFQICECPVLFARLEVLNLSGNHLTDACGSYLSTILQNCRALYSLNIERCCITTRTIQKVADALNTDSVLANLCIGYNDPVSGNAIIKVLTKLATLKSFAELNLSGLKLNKPVVESLCQLAKTSCLSRLMLRSTGIGNDGALQLTESLFGGSQDAVKLDVSYCGLTSRYIHGLATDVALICGIIELNLGGNPILLAGANALVSLLMNPQCCLKILVLNKCQLGLTGLLRIIQALAEDGCLKELNIADNIDLDKKPALPYGSMREDTLLPNLSTDEPSSNMSASKEADNDRQGSCAVNTDCNQLEVADSEDDASEAEAAPSDFDDGCASSCRKDSSFECQFILELSTAIGMAKQLQSLDLSSNGFSITEAETLYSAWSSRLPSGLAFKHIKDQIIHFSDETTMCCEVKPCCRKD